MLFKKFNKLTFLAINALRFSFVNGGHWMMFLGVKFKLVVQRLAFLAQLTWDVWSSKDGANSSEVRPIAVINDLKH
jgi:hypothetical protein